MDDFVLSVKQIAQYERARSLLGPSAAAIPDLFVIQRNGPGGPYMSIDGATIFSTLLATEGWLQLAPGPLGGIAFNGASLMFASGTFNFSERVAAPEIDGLAVNINGQPAATIAWVSEQLDTIVNNTVWSVNGRSGRVVLDDNDIRQAGAAPINSPSFSGQVTAPTPWNVYANDNTVATVAWVQQWACTSGLVVSSINGRGGAVVLNPDDISIALSTQPGYALANTPPLGDASRRIANTLFVDGSIEDLRAWTTQQFETYSQIVALGYAPLNSPNFIGVPTAPTAPVGSNTGQIATTAFVAASVAAATTGVSSFEGRTGAVVLLAADVVAAGGAPLVSPAFTGTPSAPTAAPGNNSTLIATTAFVDAAVAAVNAGVTTFNSRTGAVNLTTADVTAVGAALLSSPAFSGTPTAPTAAPTNNTTQIATTAFVNAAIAALPASVTSFNGRSGAITLIGADVSAAGGALTASPQFTGTPTAPTAVAGTSNTQLATTAFVQQAITGATAGVSTFNGRSGAVTLAAADVTGVGGALLASPTFTGTPSAPTAGAGTNTTQLATTAFVQAALSAAPGGVSSFNSRTGAIVLNSGDISAAGGALNASPAFSGTPTAPTATPGTSTGQLATTAFVAAAIAAGGGVSSFNGRAGNVTFTAADLVSVSGALLSVGAAPPTGAPATANSALWWDSTNGVLYLNYNDGNSTQWVAMGPPVVQATAGYQAFTYTTPGAATFTTPANSSTSTVYKARMQAGGGGGGGCGTGATTAAAGAGGGEYKELLLTGIAPNTAIALAIGAAGAPGSNVTSTPGGTGGNTTMTIGGQTVVCNGGVGGGWATAAGWSAPGGAGGANGATPAIAGLTLLFARAGQSGGVGTGSYAGYGGDSGLGNGGTNPINGPNASALPVGFGGGGVGALTIVAAGANSNQTGGPGAIFIERVWG